MSTASRPLWENNRTSAVAMEAFGKGGDSPQSLFGFFSIDKYRPAMLQIKRDTRNSFTQLFFAYEFGVYFAQIPNQWRNVKHALVIGCDDIRLVFM